jgi:hypothetical protein
LGDARGESRGWSHPEAKDDRMRSNQLVTILVVVVLVLLLIYLARALF